MKKLELAIFLSLNGRAEEAIEFYQSVLNGKLLFKITNKEFKESANPDMVIAEGKENLIFHSITQIGDIQLQIADNPIYPEMSHEQGDRASMSIYTEDVESAQEIYNGVVANRQSQIIQTPVENGFAEFSAIVRDPFGILMQIIKERSDAV